MRRRYGRGQHRRKRAYGAQRNRRRRTVQEELDRALHVSLEREDVLSLMQESLDQFAVEIGRRVAVGLLDDEVEQLCGQRHEWGQAERIATRHGRQQGYICVGGQKIGIQRPRVRSTRGQGEVPLARYEDLQRRDTLAEAFLRRMVRGVSTRDYEGVIDLAATGCGVKKSSVSRGFVRASAASLEAWASRSLSGTRFVAVLIDGIEYAEETMLVALGINPQGHKQVLGLRQGATENAQVVTSLLEELQQRGLDSSRPTLFVLDGAKALVSGVKRVFGRNAVVQRCQIHKQRNVKAHLPQRHHAELQRRLSEAYAQVSDNKARSLLQSTVGWLLQISPDAAASLEEGLEETLTVVRLSVPELLRRTLSSTNVIESALSVTRNVTSRVKRWREGDMRRRWCAAGLMRAEQKFKRVKGYRQIPQLVAALDAQRLDAKGKAG